MCSRPFINGVVDFETSEVRLSAAKEYLSSVTSDELENDDDDKKFSLDFKKMLADADLNEAWPTLKTDLEENAEYVLGKKRFSTSRIKNFFHGYSSTMKHLVLFLQIQQFICTLEVRIILGGIY